MSEKLIGLEDLPDDFRIRIKDSFRAYIFKKVLEKVFMQDLSKRLNYSRKTIEAWRRGYSYTGGGKVQRFIKVEIVKKLLKISEIDLEKTEKSVEGINANALTVKIRLPIKTSKELASIIGHCFGDGYVGSGYFGYFNKNKHLINEVRKNMELTFNITGNVIKSRGVYFLYFPSVLSKLLTLIGASLGNKIKQKLQVPQWIKNGSKELKAAFLRALFDDEGSVKFDGYDRSIHFRLSKNDSLLIQHKEFIKVIQSLLFDLGVETTDLHEYKGKNGVNGKTINVGFSIHGRVNLKFFLDEIGFKHPRKMKTLICGIESYVQIQYRKGEINRLILEELKNCPKDSFTIANKLDRDFRYVLNKLQTLEKKGYVEKLPPSNIWKINTQK